MQVLHDELMVGSGSAEWPQAYSVITLALMQVAPCEGWNGTQEGPSNSYSTNEWLQGQACGLERTLGRSVHTLRHAPHTNPERTPLGKESLERGRKRELSKLAVYSSLSKVNIFAFCFSECQHSVMPLASPRMLMRPPR